MSENLVFLKIFKVGSTAFQLFFCYFFFFFWEINTCVLVGNWSVKINCLKRNSLKKKSLKLPMHPIVDLPKPTEQNKNETSKVAIINRIREIHGTTKTSRAPCNWTTEQNRNVHRSSYGRDHPLNSFKSARLKFPLTAPRFKSPAKSYWDKQQGFS